MPGVDDSSSKIAHLLALDVVDAAKMPSEERVSLIDQLSAIVRGGIRFSVADAARKVILLPDPDGLTLVFLGEPAEAMECAVEFATDLKKHPDIKWRMAIHSGPITQTMNDDKSSVAGEAVDVVHGILSCGDANHILISKRLGYDLATAARWNTHLFELGDCETHEGQTMSLVNFHTGEIGNSAVPMKIQRARADARKRARRRRLARRFVFGASALALGLTTAFVIVWMRGELGNAPTAPIPERSIAVLPFADVSPGRDQQYFCDGISEEVHNALAKVPEIRVISTASSFTFRNKNAPLNEIGHKLGVATVLQGELHRDGNLISGNAQLTETRTGFVLWSGKIDRQTQDVFEIENQITNSVVRSLKVKNPPREERVPDNIGAYDVYLQGLFLSRKGDEVSLRAGLEQFQRALDEDQQLGQAWTAIARNWIQLAEMSVRPLDAYRRVRNAAERALLLDDRDAEARCFFAETKRILDWDVRGDEEELKRALQIEPSLEKAHVYLGLVRGCTGSLSDYVDESQTAVRLNPLSPAAASLLVTAFVDAGRLDESLKEAQRLIEIDPNYLYFEPALALVYRQQGKLKEALEIYQRLEQSRKNPTPGLAITYAQLDRKDDAHRVLDQLIQRATAYYFPADQIAAVYATLGENDEAFRWLDRAADEHSLSVHRIAFAREFRQLHSDARFISVLKRIGLDPEGTQKK